MSNRNSPKNKLNNEIFDERIKNKPIQRIGNYINSQEKIKFLCLKCANEWEALPHNILTHHGCPKCNDTKLSNEILDFRLKNREIRRIGVYKNKYTKIIFKCLKEGCGNTWEAMPSNIMSGTGCPECKRRIPLKEVNRNLKLMNIELIGKYKNNISKCEFKCLICKNIWSASFGHVYSGNSSCQECSTKLKSEKRIYTLLCNYIKSNVIERHKKFSFNNRKYITDFYIVYNDFKIIIEYNGKQHYEPVQFGNMSLESAKNKFLLQIKRDEELRIYCKNNNIFLLEIPYYWKENKIIEELQKILVSVN